MAIIILFYNLNKFKYTAIIYIFKKKMSFSFDFGKNRHDYNVHIPLFAKR